MTYDPNSRLRLYFRASHLKHYITSFNNFLRISIYIITWNAPAAPTNIAELVLDCHQLKVSFESSIAWLAEHLQALAKFKKMVINFVMTFWAFKPTLAACCLKYHLRKQPSVLRSSLPSTVRSTQINYLYLHIKYVLTHPMVCLFAQSCEQVQNPNVCQWKSSKETASNSKWGQPKIRYT